MHHFCNEDLSRLDRFFFAPTAASPTFDWCFETLFWASGTLAFLAFLSEVNIIIYTWRGCNVRYVWKIQSSRFFWALLTISPPPHYSLMLRTLGNTRLRSGRSIQSRLVSRITIHKGSSILFAKKQKVYFKKNEEAELRVVFSSACQMLFLLYVTTRLHIKLWWKGVKIGMRG